MPEEREDHSTQSTPQHSRPKLTTTKYYDIATTLFSTGRAGELIDLFIAAARDGDYNRIENLLQRRGDALVSVDVKDKRTGNTALIWAAKRGHTKIVQLLLRHGADVTLKNYDGKTAVEISSPALKTLLLDAVNQSSLSVHQRLLQAAWQGNSNIVKQLLTESRTFDIDCVNGDGLTPLLLLCRDLQLFERLSTQLRKDYNPSLVLSILLDHRANIHATDSDGKTCLHYVSQSKGSFAKQLVDILLNQGSETDLRDRQCFTPIHFASQTGNVDVINSLIDGGAEVNGRGFAGTTPLHYTAYNDHDRAAATLLDHGADILLTDDQGLTALDVARSKKMKNRLREAWTEVSQTKQEVNLAPVRDGSRMSFRDDTPDLRTYTPRRPTGEVLFDGLPLNPFINNFNNAKRAKTPGEKLRLAEEQMLAQVEKERLTPSGLNNRDGMRRFGVRRPTKNHKPTALPVSSRSPEKLPPVKGDWTESLIIKTRTNSGTLRYQRSLTDLSKSTKTSRLAKLYTYPRGSSKSTCIANDLNRDSPISVHRLAPDEDNRLSRVCATPGRNTPGQLRPNRQSSSRGTPQRQRNSISSPSLVDLAVTCNDYLHPARRRFLSTPSCGVSDDFEEEELQFSPHQSPRSIPSPRNVQQPLQGNKMSSSQELYALGVRRSAKSCTPDNSLYPNSKKVLPPTLIQKSLSNLEHITHSEFKENSPGSSGDFEEGICLASENQIIEVKRPKVLFKSEFVIEESRPKDLIIPSSGSDSCDSVESNPAKEASATLEGSKNTVTMETVPTSASDASIVNTGATTTTSSESNPTKSTPNIRTIHPASLINNNDSSNLPTSGSQGDTVNPSNIGATKNTETKPMSSREKLILSAKENAERQKPSVTSSVNISFSGNDTLVVQRSLDSQLNSTQKRVTEPKSVSAPKQSSVGRPSNQPLVKKSTDNSVNLRNNSGYRKPLAVQPTKLISSMKKRAIQRSKQNNSEKIVKAEAQPGTPGTSAEHQTNSPVKTTTSNTVSVQDKTMSTNSSPEKTCLSNLVKSERSMSQSISTAVTSNTNIQTFTETAPSGSNPPQDRIETSVEPIGKTPLVSIFSSPSLPRLSSGYLDGPPIEQTPLIVNPFEDFFPGAQDHETVNKEAERNSPTKTTRVGSASSKKQITKAVKNSKPMSQKDKQPASNAKKRVSSGRKRGTQKGAGQDSSTTNPRPKSKACKRVRSGKGRGKKSSKETLGQDAAKSDVALISGIGWHIATSCDDKSDIQAVKLNLESDSSDEELADMVATPRLLAFRPFSSPSPRFVELKKDNHPEQLSEAIPPMNLDMSRNTINRHLTSRSWDSNQPRVEVIVSHPTDNPDHRESHSAVTPSMALPLDVLSAHLSPIPESPLLSTTSSAIENFSKTVSDDVLTEMINGKQDNVKCDDQQTFHLDLEDGGSDSDDTLVSNRSQTDKDHEHIKNCELTQFHNEKSPNQSSRFIEKKRVDEEESLDDIVDEILSATGPPSLNSTLRSNKSINSRNSTLTETDVKMLKNLQNTDSPFHAKAKDAETKTVIESEDFEEPLGTNPDLLRVFHGEDYKLGQKMKAMIDAGAESSRVEAMLGVDNEAKQLERIIHSFKKMELHASSKQEVVEGPQECQSPYRGRSSTLDNSKTKQSQTATGRPHSSSGFTSASKARRGRFTEIKEDTQITKLHLEEDRGSRNDVQGISKVDSKPPLLNDNSSKHSEYESQDGHRSSSACSSSSVQSLSNTQEDTICWKKGNILGRGAFGTVWCGLTGDGELIAVKQIELNTSDMKKAEREYEKIQEEVELLKTLTHKNIVGYLGTSFEDHFVSIYMQFVPGGSIASVLARFGALEERIFCLYTKQILQGVEYLHNNDVIHRDIKGGNIMLMPTGVIKLIDFGCAKRLCINLSMSRSQILKSMKGTPYWMAPEVVNETGHGKKSDIWSIGCTVFEMATRKPPWSEMSPIAAIFAIGCDKPIPELPENFSKDVRDFVSKCLTRDQDQRLSACEALQHRFITRRRKSRAS